MAHPIPDAALDTHIGVLGRTGTGKTYTARGLVERLLDAKRHVVIVDPTGAWWGLRSLYPIPIFGGEHGDVSIADDSGAAVAETILSHHTSAIVDLSLLARESHAAMRRFMTGLVGRLKDRDKGALWLVVDEADEFMPQVLSPDMTRLFGDLRWIVRRGRIAGWRVMMITQRPQDIAKAMLTQIGTLVAHRLTAPQDRKAVEEWVKGHADEGEAKQVLTSLASLADGEAWAWSPDHGLLVRAKMPLIKSFDSGATPDADSGTIEQPALAAIDLGGIRATLEAKGEAPAKSISAAANVGGKIDAPTLRDCPTSDLIDELDRRDPQWFHDYPEFKAAIHDRNEFRSKAEHYNACIEAAVRALGYRDIEEIGRDLDQKRLDAELQPARIPLATGAANTGGGHEVAQTRESKPEGRRFSESRRPAQAANGEGSIPASQQRVLDAIAWWEAIGITPVERNRASVIAGLSPKASTFGVYVSKLAQAGLVDTSAPGAVALTDTGRAVANSPGKVNRREVVLQARSMLKPAAANVFDEIVARYPDWVDRGNLADIVGLSRTASTLGVYVSESSKLGFVETKPGKVRAAEWMMP